MYIEKLRILGSDEEIRNYINSLTKENLKALYTEIEDFNKEIEQKVLKAQAKNEQINLQLEEKKKELQSLGIKDLDALREEIQRLQSLITEDLVNYTNILKNYGG